MGCAYLNVLLRDCGRGGSGNVGVFPLSFGWIVHVRLNEDKKLLGLF
jgi:hypothetical protein